MPIYIQVPVWYNIDTEGGERHGQKKKRQQKAIPRKDTFSYRYRESHYSGRELDQVADWMRTGRATPSPNNNRKLPESQDYECFKCNFIYRSHYFVNMVNR